MVMSVAEPKHTCCLLGKLQCPQIKYPTWGSKYIYLGSLKLPVRVLTTLVMHVHINIKHTQKLPQRNDDAFQVLAEQYQQTTSEFKFGA